MAPRPVLTRFGHWVTGFAATICRALNSAAHAVRSLLYNGRRAHRCSQEGLAAVGLDSTGEREDHNEGSEGPGWAIRGRASSLSRRASGLSHRRAPDKPYAKGALALSQQCPRHVLCPGGNNPSLSPAAEGRGASVAGPDFFRPPEAPAPRHQCRRHVRGISRAAGNRRVRFRAAHLWRAMLCGRTKIV
jgi:hypothetical protein